MAHSIELRTRAVELLKEGYTQDFVSKILNIGTTSLNHHRLEAGGFVLAAEAA